MINVRKHRFAVLAALSMLAFGSVACEVDDGDNDRIEAPADPGAGVEDENDVDDTNGVDDDLGTDDDLETDDDTTG